MAEVILHVEACPWVLEVDQRHAHKAGRVGAGQVVVAPDAHGAGADEEGFVAPARVPACPLAPGLNMISNEGPQQEETLPMANAADPHFAERVRESFARQNVMHLIL